LPIRIAWFSPVFFDTLITRRTEGDEHAPNR
jgi:hypothetical protein